MTTVAIRTAAKRQLHQIIAQAIAPERAAVLYGPDRQLEEGDQVILGPVTGVETSVPNMKAGRKQYHDRFRIMVVVTSWVAGRFDLSAAEERAEELFELVRDQLVESPTLGGLDGVISAVIEQVDGPDSWVAQDGTGVGAGLKVTVDVQARTT